ncbi:MAG: carboxymuconolactone decarboxylase family protein [Kofleriaceae bacterium]
MADTDLRLPIHSLKTAPDSSRPILEQVGKKYGFVPNLMGVFANAPVALQTYIAISEQFGQTSLPPLAREVVLLTTARANACHYCVAVHSMIASMAKLPAAAIEAIRNDEAIADPALEAVRLLTRSIVIDRGHPDPEVVRGFLANGFQSSQVLEVLVGITLKTLSNYTNHLAHTPLDTAFTPHSWEPKR